MQIYDVGGLLRLGHVSGLIDSSANTRGIMQKRTWPQLDKVIMGTHVALPASTSSATTSERQRMITSAPVVYTTSTKALVHELIREGD